MSDHVLGEFPDLTPDHLRHTFIKPHDCPGLEPCTNHPRWRVWKNPVNKWWVTEPPGPGSTLHWQGHYTHAEAINHAQKEATK